ncbi:glycosyltransferase family protein [Geomonas ferrireducens]|uniref:glycosyltransferase family 4 protein n=1 Tax=Geomonas ferrireducens TaxID=2570227 RepID=UPI0010A8C998|nr:glycosyltransferase family 4 protein [Geomonas ferrireducens]
MPNVESEIAPKPVVVFLEDVTILDRPYLHRFFIAQAKEFLSLNAKVIFCTKDCTPLLQKFLDDHITGAFADRNSGRNSIKKYNPTILFISSVITGAKLYLLHVFFRKKANIVFWYQGLIPEESFLRRNSNLRRCILLLLEHLGLEISDIVLLPTQSMLDYLKDANRLPQKNKYIVIPNAISALPPLTSESKKLWAIESNTSPTIGYCGGLSRWQCFPAALHFVKKLQELDPNVLFLILTFDSQKALDMLSENGISNAVVRSTTPDQVYKYVQAFDVGILFREEGPVNAAAFPLKYLDYISNGVPVLTTHALKAIFDDAKATHGCVLNLDDIDYSSVLSYIKDIASDKTLITKSLRQHCADRWMFHYVNRQAKRAFKELLQKTSANV